MTTTIQRLIISNSSTDRTDYLEAVYIILVPRLVWQMLVCLKIKVRLKHNPLPFLKAENNWFKRKQCLRNQAKQWNKGAARLVTSVMAGMPGHYIGSYLKRLGSRLRSPGLLPLLFLGMTIILLKNVCIYKLNLALLLQTWFDLIPFCIAYWYQRCTILFDIVLKTNNQIISSFNILSLEALAINILLECLCWNYQES